MTDRRCLAGATPDRVANLLANGSQNVANKSVRSHQELTTSHSGCSFISPELTREAAE